MKRILLSIALLSSIYLSAQTVIVEEKFEKENLPTNFKYLSNSKRFIVFKGQDLKMIVTNLTTSAVSFDINGEKSNFFNNEKLIDCQFSITENSYKALDFSNFSFNPNNKFFLNNASHILDSKVIKDINFSYFGEYDHNNVLKSLDPNQISDFSGAFNDYFVFGFTNQKGKKKIDFEGDDLYLESIDIKTSIKKRIKIEKPDLTLLKGDSFAKTGLTFSCKLKGNENFDLITKSVSSDFKTTTLYKHTYNFEGRIIKVLPFVLKLNESFFMASANNGGPEFVYVPNNSSSINNKFFSLNILSINNYFEDRINGDIYIYGIFTDKAISNINGKSNPKGFYIFKFNKEGEKLWESINKIEDKEFFERVNETYKLRVNLLEYNKDLIFSISVNDFTEFSHAAIVDKLSGSISHNSFIEYNNNKSKGKDKAFISNTYVSKDLKNKVFSQISFVAMSINPNVLKYVKSLPVDRERLYFETIFSDQGIWFIETDNEQYYKVSLFKD
jgi:hypothetical protein